MNNGHLKILHDRWKLTTAVVLCALIGAGTVSAMTPPTYTSKIMLYVVAGSGGDQAADTYQASLLAQERTRQYVQLASTTRVGQLVVERLGLATSPAELASRIEASSSLESVLLEVSTRARSADEAVAMANTIGEVFPGLVAEIERRSTPGGVSVTVRVIDKASTPDTDTVELLLFNLALGLLGGLVAGIGVAYAFNALSGRRAGRDGGPTGRDTPTAPHPAWPYDVEPSAPQRMNHGGGQRPTGEAPAPSGQLAHAPQEAPTVLGRSDQGSITQHPAPVAVPPGEKKRPSPWPRSPLSDMQSASDRTVTDREPHLAATRTQNGDARKGAT